MLNAPLPEAAQIAPIVPVADLGAAASTGDWLSMKNYKRACIIFQHSVGTAAEDPILTLLQGTSVAGAGSKALNVTEYYVKRGTLLAEQATFTKTAMTEGNAITSVGELETLIAVDIPSDALDVQNSFDCISVTIADPGTVAAYGYVLAILYDPRDATEPMATALS